MTQAETKMDLIMTVHLSKLRHGLDAIERYTRNALDGRYEDD